jgi:hypothetical protein
MTTRCPAGHESQADDYCDVCGLKLGPPTGPAVERETAALPAEAQAAVEAAVEAVKVCPNCGANTDPDGRYCENCGFDFETDTPLAHVSPDSPRGWEAVVSADRAFYDRFDAAEVAFPTDYRERHFVLSSPEIAIGRRATDIVPGGIDLSGEPEDTAISRDHAVLRQNGDGWSLTDCGSTNGTFINEDREPIAPDEPVVIMAGDRIHVGAWTTIALRTTST